MFRPPFRLGAALATVVCATTLAACRGEESLDDPVAAVDAFIAGGVVDNNGTVACAYLTPAERHAVSLTAGSTGCKQAFERAGLSVGRHRITSEADLRALTTHATVDGNRARVRLARSGAAVEFVLVKAGPEERNEFQAPHTEWRIAEGAPRVVPHAGARSRL